jgi:hypothetical protein
MGMGTMGTHVETYSTEKIMRIREKIEVVFGSRSTWDDLTISQRYNITPEGDLIMILR